MHELRRAGKGSRLGLAQLMLPADVSGDERSPDIRTLSSGCLIRESKASAGRVAGGRLFIFLRRVQDATAVLQRREAHAVRRAASAPMEQSLMKARLLLPILGLAFVGVMTYTWRATEARASFNATASETRGEMAPARQAPGAETVEVRFVNAMPGSAALEIGQDSVMLFSNVVFGAVSPYKIVARGARRFTLRNPASTSYDAVVSATLAEGARYSVVALSDAVGQPELRVILDELTPDSGMARVRVINAAPAVGDVVVRLRGGDEPFLTAVSGTGLAAARDVPPTTTGFSIRTLDNRPLATLDAMAMTAGASLTIVIAGPARGEVTAIAFVDSVATASRAARASAR